MSRPYAGTPNPPTRRLCSPGSADPALVQVRRGRMEPWNRTARSPSSTATSRSTSATDLPPLLDEAAHHGQVVVFHSAVIAYLEPHDRERFQQMMTALVADGACRWVSNEAPAVLPGVAPADAQPSGRFVLALDGRAVARTHGHGRSMTWL